MSETIFDSLPRFDQPNSLPLSDEGQSGSTEEAFELAADQLPEIEPSLSSSHDQLNEDDSDCCEHSTDTTIAIETTLTELSDAIDRVECQAREQVVAATLSISAQLFPELSRLFMAEEIGRHLPTLVPISCPAVSIRADISLLEDLQEVVNRTGRLAAHCTLLPTDIGARGQVDISWQTGGVSFDFSGVLNACLAQLHDTQLNIGA